MKFNILCYGLGGWKLWKKLSFFVAFPAVGLGMLNAYLAHQEHAHAEQPEFIPYEFLRVRTKVNNKLTTVAAILFSSKEFIKYYTKKSYQKDNLQWIKALMH